MHGVFVHNKNLPLPELFQLLLEKWYREYLHDPNVDAKARLIEILQDSEEHQIAFKLKAIDEI